MHYREGVGQRVKADPRLRRCQAIPGVGPLSALAMVATYHRGQFRRADAFIAFMGMDVRVRDSGTFRGRRKLTKKGDSELRRLLFNAAMQGRRSVLWEPYYLALRARGSEHDGGLCCAGQKARESLLCIVSKRDRLQQGFAF